MKPQPSASQAGARDATGRRTIPATCASAHQRNRGQVQHQAGQRHPAEKIGRHRQQTRAPPQPMPSSSERHAPTSLGARGEPCSGQLIQIMPAVAPNDSRNAGSATASGSTATRTPAATLSPCSGSTAMVDRPREKIEDGHQHRTIDRRAAFDYRAVREKRRNRGHHRGPSQHTGPPEPGQRQRRQNRDVAAGDGDDVIGARLLQRPLEVGVQSGAVTDEDGGDQTGGGRTPTPDVTRDHPAHERPG